MGVLGGQTGSGGGQRRAGSPPGPGSGPPPAARAAAGRRGKRLLRPGQGIRAGTGTGESPQAVPTRPPPPLPHPPPRRGMKPLRARQGRGRLCRLSVGKPSSGKESGSIKNQLRTAKRWVPRVCLPLSPRGFPPGDRHGDEFAALSPGRSAAGAAAGSPRAGGNRKAAEETRCLSPCPSNPTGRFFRGMLGSSSLFPREPCPARSRACPPPLPARGRGLPRWPPPPQALSQKGQEFGIIRGVGRRGRGAPRLPCTGGRVSSPARPGAGVCVRK